MKYLPKDPAILVGSINILLRDEEFGFLESLYYNFNEDIGKLKASLREASYIYNEKQYQFRSIGFDE